MSNPVKSIDRARLLEFVESLGFDPIEVAEVHIDPGSVQVTEYVLVDGRKRLAPGGNDVAKRVHHIPIMSGIAELDALQVCDPVTTVSVPGGVV